MTEKTLRGSLYALTAAVALYLVITLAGDRDAGQNAGDGGLADALDGIDRAEATLAEIAGPSDTVRLAREGDAWTVNGFTADSAAVERFLRALDETEATSVASTNPDNHARLGVDADSAWTLSIGDGPAILLGKPGARYRTAFARMPDSDVTSLLTGDLRSAAARPLSDWRDKTVLRADTALIAAVRVTRDGATTTYERGDSVWTAAGREVEDATIRGILQELAHLRASGFAPSDSEMPERPDRAVRVFDAEGAEIASLSLVEGDGDFHVATPASPYVFVVAAFRANRVTPALPGDEGG